MAYYVKAIGILDNYVIATINGRERWVRADVYGVTGYDSYLEAADIAGEYGGNIISDDQFNHLKKLVECDNLYEE